MRAFKNESIYDKESGKWSEVYYIDGNEVELEEYFQGIEDEENDIGSSELGELCECCKCEDSDTCDDYECTCDNGDNREDDLEDCQCNECRKERFYHLLTDTLNHIVEADGCPNCILGTLLDFCMEFEDMGFKVVKG